MIVFSGFSDCVGYEKSNQHRMHLIAGGSDTANTVLDYAFLSLNLARPKLHMRMSNFTETALDICTAISSHRTLYNGI